MEKISEAASRFDVVFGNFGHAGDGNLHPTCLTDERDKKEIDNAHRAFEFIFNEAIKLEEQLRVNMAPVWPKNIFLNR
jgi:glycolate oxidase